MGEGGQISVRLAAGQKLAESLTGLDRSSAEERVTQHGFRPQLVGPQAEAITADLNVSRIRIFLDEHDVVIRASAG